MVCHLQVSWCIRLGAHVSVPLLQFFNGLAFFSEGFLMVVHGKHEMFDGLVHQLLGWTMLLGALAIWLEFLLRHDILASAFRGFAVILQGVWLCEIGQMMFAGEFACQSCKQESAGTATLAQNLRWCFCWARLPHRLACQPFAS